MTKSADAYDLTVSDLARGAWTVVSIDDLGHTPELAIESGTTVADLRRMVAVRRLHSQHGAVVAVVGPYVGTEFVVGALEEGADACVRGFEPKVVRAHLSAIYRRQVQHDDLVPS